MWRDTDPGTTLSLDEVAIIAIFGKSVTYYTTRGSKQAHNANKHHNKYA
jgi:hypothetical protein